MCVLEYIHGETLSREVVILRCILHSKTELPQESKLTLHPLKILKHPDKKLYSLTRNPLRKPYKALKNMSLPV